VGKPAWFKGESTPALQTDEILDLPRNERISWVIDEVPMEPGTERTLWFDEVTFS
jgi:hypothetical protein